VEELKNAIHTFYIENKPEPERQLIVHTGMGGMKMLNDAMKKEVDEQAYRRRVNTASFEISKLKVENLITFEEWENLKKMCHSEDRENLIVVEAIIEHHEQRRISTSNILPGNEK
jgi:hypothetical protein